MTLNLQFAVSPVWLFKIMSIVTAFSRSRPNSTANPPQLPFRSSCSAWSQNMSKGFHTDILFFYHILYPSLSLLSLTLSLACMSFRCLDVCRGLSFFFSSHSRASVKPAVSPTLTQHLFWSGSPARCLSAAPFQSNPKFLLQQFKVIAKHWTVQKQFLFSFCALVALCITSPCLLLFPVLPLVIEQRGTADLNQF